jgi:hypothetical protein
MASYLGVGLVLAIVLLGIGAAIIATGRGLP